MKALVVYESVFGNTKDIAESVARGLATSFDDVQLLEVSHAGQVPADVDLLVVGGPTHAWSMSRGQSREDAGRQAAQKGKAPVSTGIGVREFLDALVTPSKGVAAAAFDTAIKTKWLPHGSAAKAEGKQLLRHGYHLVADPEQFWVKDTDGPLDDGELERAHAWGASLAHKLAH